MEVMKMMEIVIEMYWISVNLNAIKYFLVEISNEFWESKNW